MADHELLHDPNRGTWMRALNRSDEIMAEHGQFVDDDISAATWRLGNRSFCLFRSVGKHASGTLEPHYTLGVAENDDPEIFAIEYSGPAGKLDGFVSRYNTEHPTPEQCLARLTVYLSTAPVENS